MAETSDVRSGCPGAPEGSDTGLISFSMLVSGVDRLADRSEIE
jgi:hypothetical protein